MSSYYETSNPDDGGSFRYGAVRRPKVQPKAAVLPTDCRTGYQVWFGGRLYLTVRRREEATRIAAKLNGGHNTYA